MRWKFQCRASRHVLNGLREAAGGMLRSALFAAIVAGALAPATTSAMPAVSPAAVIAGQLVTSDTVILTVSDYTAPTDPDGLLGLAGEYIAKAQFADSADVNGYVEVFGNTRDATTRMLSLSGAMATGQEIDFQPNQSPVVLRLFNVSQGGAQAYRNALLVAVGEH